MPTVLGVFDNRSQAERAAEELKSQGFLKDDLSIVARSGYGGENEANGNDYRMEMVNDEGGGEGNEQNLSAGTTTGGALGGLTGLLAGAGLFTIPGLGPILALGPIVSGLAGAAAGGVAGSLIDMGIEPEKSRRYEEHVERGGILTAVNCSQEKINDAAGILRRNGAKDVESF